MKRSLSFLMILCILAAVFGWHIPAGAAKTDTGYESRRVKAYLFSKDETAVFDCLFRSDLPSVPYISPDDYINQLYEIPFTVKDNADGTYTVSCKNGDMVVDPGKDTVHFDCYEDFMWNDAKPILDSEPADYLGDDSDMVIVGETKPVDLDLSAYDIDIAEKDGRIYFPVSILNDLFCDTYRAALYIDGELFFTEVMADEPYYDDSSLYDSIQRDQAMIDYTYNELCFTIDNLYGMPPKAKVADAIRRDGLDKTLDTFDSNTAHAKELLLSDSMVDFSVGTMILDSYFDDGGHTVLSSGLQMAANSYPDSAVGEGILDALYDYSDPDAMFINSYILDQYNVEMEEEKLLKHQNTFYADMDTVKEWDDALLVKNGSTCLFRFREFKEAVVKSFKWSLDYAAEHDIENFIIDLSTNYGGSTAVAAYMLAVMCDLTTTYDLCTLSGNKLMSTVVIDKNLDGAFDEKDDEVSYDLNFAILTSKFSFSCGNLMPALAQEQGIPVIGETSGGGTCAMNVHYYPEGSMYSLSGTDTIILSAGGDVDSGAVPDIPMAYDGRYKGFYNLGSMNEGIDAFYNHRPLPTQPPTAVQPETRDPYTDQDDSDDLSAGWEFVATSFRLVGAILSAVLIGFLAGLGLTVFIIRRDKKKYDMQRWW